MNFANFTTFELSKLIGQSEVSHLVTANGEIVYPPAGNDEELRAAVRALSAASPSPGES